MGSVDSASAASVCRYPLISKLNNHQVVPNLYPRIPGAGRARPASDASCEACRGRRGYAQPSPHCSNPFELPSTDETVPLDARIPAQPKGVSSESAAFLSALAKWPSVAAVYLLVFFPRRGG